MNKLRMIAVALVLLLGVSVMSAQTTGFKKGLEVFGGPGLSKDSKYNFGLAVNAGSQVSEKFYIGGGIAYKYAECLYFKGFVGNKSTESRTTRNLLPIYARAKYNFTTSSVAPFLSVDAGYNISLDNNEHKNIEGFFFEPQVGLDFTMGSLSSFVTLGVNVQNYHYDYFSLETTLDGDREKKYMIGMFNIHFGFWF